MATEGGPNIITDGLVFGFDTGYPLVSTNDDSYKFNKGEPTYNWIDHQNAVVQSSYTAWTGPNSGNWVANHPDAIQVVNKLGNSITGYYNSGVTDAANTHHAHWIYDNELKRPVVQMRDLDAQWKAKSFNTGKTPTAMGLAHGGSYTISWLQWSDTVGKGADAGLYGSSPSGFHDGRSYSTTTQTVANTWERKSYTESALSTSFNTGSNVSIYMYGHTTPPNTSGIIKIADVQLEIISHSTPLSTPSRSVSGSLIDLTRTTDIDVSNVSFDSNAQMNFDGTDDRIPITDLLNGESIGSSTELTISIWVKCDSYGDRMVFSTGQTGNDRIYCWTQNSKHTWRVGNFTSTSGHSTLPPAGTWFNTVLVINGTNVAAYLNGEEDYTGTYSAFTTADYATFGRHGSGNYGNYYFDGTIAIAKIYTTGLSDEEVKQNYNAIKSRFELS